MLALAQASTAPQKLLCQQSGASAAVKSSLPNVWPCLISSGVHVGCLQVLQLQEEAAGMRVSSQHTIAGLRDRLHTAEAESADARTEADRAHAELRVCAREARASSIAQVGWLGWLQGGPVLLCMYCSVTVREWGPVELLFPGEGLHNQEKACAMHAEVPTGPCMCRFPLVAGCHLWYGACSIRASAITGHC